MTKREKAEIRSKLLYLQDDRCAICRRKYQLRFMTVDHDHALEKEGYGWKARGVLCSRCNRALGQFEWTDATIDAAIIYLQRIQALRKEVRTDG